MSTMTATLASFSLLRARGKPGWGYAELDCTRPGQLLSNTEESIFGRCTSVLHNSACPSATVAVSCLKLQILKLHGLHVDSSGPCMGVQWHMWVLEGRLWPLCP